MKNQNTIFTTILLALACFAFPQRAPAVVPAPDGGYPGGNTAEGQSALLSLTTGTYNTAVGWFSLRSDAASSFNTAVGAGALLLDVGDQTTGEGIENTAVGAAALLFNTTGFLNTANGAFALFSNTTGTGNTATGNDALFNNTTGGSNTAVGNEALFNNITGGGNTAVGRGALMGNSGFGNIALGDGAGRNITGNYNIAIGNFGFANADNSIVIGNDTHTDCHIAGIYNSVLLSGEPVIVTSDGKLGYLPSSARFKRDIEPMGTSSKALLALKPVTFHYKSDTTNAPQFGLVAEEVAKVNPDLVVRNNKGELHTVRYDAVNAMLLNEFLKEHRKVEDQERKLQEQQATICELKNQMGAVVAQLKQQAAQIQKVGAQIETSKPALRTVLYHQ